MLFKLCCKLCERPRGLLEMHTIPHETIQRLILAKPRKISCIGHPMSWSSDRHAMDMETAPCLPPDRNTPRSGGTPGSWRYTDQAPYIGSSCTVPDSPGEYAVLLAYTVPIRQAQHHCTLFLLFFMLPNKTFIFEQPNSNQKESKPKSQLLRNS
jgi:hypothetical protein